MTTTDHRPGHDDPDHQSPRAGPVHLSPQAIVESQPSVRAPAGAKSTDSGHSGRATQTSSAAVGSALPADHCGHDLHEAHVGGDQTEDGSAASRAAAPMYMALADPFLALAADVLDDAERTRIANENRLRQLTRTSTDADGEDRGFGLDESHPDVARLAALVDLLGQVEHQATLNLNRKLRVHPLGPWVKAQRGIGEKQAARLVAVIGDPYWNTLHDRPRTVSELWAYCGYHTIPAGHGRTDTHITPASGSQPAGGDHTASGTHGGHVAARRQKGQRANWSTAAKTRAYLIAESCLKAGGPWREVYDKRKANTEGRAHAVRCVRCGPSGKPALPGSPWSDGHRHTDALRITAKEILKALWREARRLHQGGQP